MIVLDTNVISEVMRRSPSPTVARWLNDQESAGLFLTTVSVAEIHYGLGLLPDGRRRRRLRDRFERFLAEGFQDRLLSFDEPAALEYGPLMARRRREGRPMASLDGQIAAIGRAQRSALATRNVRDFEGCGLEVIDPFAG